MEHVLSGLIKHRGELAGRIETAEINLNAMIDDLRDVDRVIRQFDADMDTGAIPMKRKGAIIPPRQCARAIFDILREGPATAPDMTTAIMTGAGMDINDRKLKKQIYRRVHGSLRWQRAQGAVWSEERDGVVRWGIVA